MLSDIIIKEEPLDPAEELQQQQQQQQQMKESKNMLMKKQIMLNDLKATYEENNGSLHAGNLQIVEEEADVITVNASDLKSEDELKFIENLKNRTNLPDVCSMCLEAFSNKGEYLRHINLKICQNEKRCTVCCLEFSDTKLLFSHLNLHRENFYFCSEKCGFYFKKLHDCIHHEVVAHGIRKIKRPMLNKIKQSEYVCSFCREIFKSELQLHVHWLDKLQGCGKAMQDVTLKINNLNASKMALPMATMPITKLRLKTSLPDSAKRNESLHSIINDVDKNHKVMDDNQINMDVDFNIQIKEEPQDESETSYTDHAIIPEVIIKTEVEDNDNKCNAAERNEIDSFISESKTQLATSIQKQNFSYNDKLNSLNTIPINLPIFTSNSRMLSTQNMNNNNEIIQLVPNVQLIKLTTTPTTSTAATTINGCSSIPPLQPIQPNINNNFKVFNLSTNNVQILQLPPNTQLINLQDMKSSSTSSSSSSPSSSSITNTISTNQKTPQPIIIKLQTKPLTAVTSVNTSIARPLPLSSPPPLTSIFNTNPIKTNPLQNITPKNLTVNTFNSVTTSNTDLLNSIKAVNSASSMNLVNTTNAGTCITASSTGVNVTNTNDTINRKMDLKKAQNLTTELAKAEDNRKNFVIPKQHLIAIESLPEKKQLIEKMIKQMKQAESLQSSMKIEPMAVSNDDTYINDKTCPSESNTLTPQIENVFPISNQQKTGPPPLLYVPILSSTDVEMVQARFEYPEYNYQLICPYCLKHYELKRSLKCHLTKLHNLTARDLQKICVQAKPFKKTPADNKPIVEKAIIKKKAKKSVSESDNSQPTNQLDNLKTEVISETTTVAKTQNPDESLEAFSIPLRSPKAIKTSVFNKIRYICNKCGRQCSSKAMLKDHILANCSRKPQYECPDCPKKFFSHGTLQCHKTIHTGELPYKCDYCDKRFRTRGQVTVHHRTHTGERPFVCQVCLTRFTHRETLIAHLSRHIGMKRYKCYGCDKNFSCISALKTHREIRPDTCGRVKFNPRAIGPRVRVIRGNVVFEPQPEINPYLRTEDPKTVLSELQNQQD